MVSVNGNESDSGVGQTGDLAYEKLPGAPIPPVPVIEIPGGNDEVHSLVECVID